MAVVGLPLFVRGSHGPRERRGIAAKEFSETLELGSPQAVWLLPKVWNPDLRAWS